MIWHIMRHGGLILLMMRLSFSQISPKAEQKEYGYITQITKLPKQTKNTRANTKNRNNFQNGNTQNWVLARHQQYIAQVTGIILFAFSSLKPRHCLP